MCTASAESIAIDDQAPTSPVDSRVSNAQEPLTSVAYLRSLLVESQYEICALSLESNAKEG